MKKFFGAWILLTVLLSSFCANAEETGEKTLHMEEITVIGEKLVTPTRQTNETVYTGSEITKKGIEAQGTKASVSVYEALNIIPGISVESPDPYGLAAEQKNVRIRGVRGYSSAMTVEGIPNYGGNPMGPREYIYDTENFESIAVYKGTVPADLGTGVGARGGAVELRSRWPEKEYGLDFSQGFGANHYSRTFARIDSGQLPKIKTGLALSYSYTDAEKWKGPGDLGPRHNFGVMLSQPIKDKDEIRIWFNANELEQNLYRPLNFKQVQDLGANYENDYNEQLTGVKEQDIAYYQYNRGDYSNRDMLAVIPFTMSDKFKMTFKPYYSNEDSEILGGSTSQGGIITKRKRDIERFGLVSQFDAGFSWFNAALGYWCESSEMIIRTQNYDPLTFAFKGYGMYMESDDKGIVSSPYLKLSGNTERFNWQAGLKYFWYKDPAGQGYTSPAPSYELIKGDDLFREEKEYDKLLPSLGVSYYLSDNIELYTAYGRNQIRPYAYMPLINLYNQNRAKFQEAGVTLNELFSGYDMEISDNFELGARFRNEWMEIMPAFFYAKHKNLLTTVYDPRVDLSYYQNTGKASGYGMDLECSFYLIRT